MSVAQSVAAAREKIAAACPPLSEVILIAVESYGQRRLYPASPSADAVAALIGAKTIEPRHLPIVERLGLTVLILDLAQIDLGLSSALYRERFRAEAVRRLSPAEAAEAAAVQGARAMMAALPDLLAPLPETIKVVLTEDDGGRRAVRDARRAYAAAKAAGTLPAPKPPQDIPEIGGEPMA